MRCHNCKRSSGLFVIQRPEPFLCEAPLAMDKSVLDRSARLMWEQSGKPGAGSPLSKCPTLMEIESSGAGIRTPDKRIMIPLL